MIIVTGGAGFIGSNLVHELNRVGEKDILIVDHLVAPHRPSPAKFLNLQGAIFSDFMDKAEFRQAIAKGVFDHPKIRAILHQGACSNTLEDDGRYMMDNNFTYSKEVLSFAVKQGIPLVYASTAAVYGLSSDFSLQTENERPLNVYGFSKLAFDTYVRLAFTQSLEPAQSTVVGLRYFNVYGPREEHKGRMASVIHHFSRQLLETGKIKMFEGSGGYGDGEQRRDFVFVKDLCRMNLFFAGLLPESPTGPLRGIYNAGTGAASSFNEVAKALIKLQGRGEVDYIPFPEDLSERYQHFTEADITGLRTAGYAAPFTTLNDGIRSTFEDATIS